MLYQIHRQLLPSGNPSAFIGYISVCISHISEEHIRDCLIQSKIISEQWLAAHEIQLVPTKSKVYGVYSYVIKKRVPPKTNLLYICPVEEKWMSEKKDTYRYISEPITFSSFTNNYRIYQNPVQAPQQVDQQIFVDLLNELNNHPLPDGEEEP